MKFILVTILIGAAAALCAGQASVSSPMSAEKELRAFYDAYAADLRAGKGAAVAERYDERGYYSLGNGSKQLVTSAEAKERYTKRWTGPKSFEWREMEFEALSADAASVTGLFDWTGMGGDKVTGSYSAVLIKRGGVWRIRVEDESVNTQGYSSKPVSGSRTTPGPYRYLLTAQPGASIAAHKHSVEMKITVKSGRKFILMGDLNTAKVRVFEAGSTFAIPANTWHVEWWETETVEDIEIIAPMTTVRALPGTPRQ